jgi:pyridoxal phosphate enzyme (YggS family)
MSTELLDRYHQVQQRINLACEKSGRDPKSVQLLAVSKTKPLTMVQELAQHGQTSFGENYVQEMLDKIKLEPQLNWHFIGPIQSNKTKHLAQNVNWVHSVDRLKIAQRLNDQRPDNMSPLNVLMEVNIDSEPTKAGFKPSEVVDAARQISQLPNLKLRGLMAIPQASSNFEQQCVAFSKMRKLLETLQNTLSNQTLDTLSMGMSGDLEAAIQEGATIVRIGTDIFGARH